MVHRFHHARDLAKTMLIRNPEMIYVDNMQLTATMALGAKA
jgi:hypothetical protein